MTMTIGLLLILLALLFLVLAAMGKAPVTIAVLLVIIERLVALTIGPGR